MYGRIDRPTYQELENKDQIKSSIEQLNTSWSEISQNMAQQPEDTSSESANSKNMAKSKNADVQEAEYEEVVDENNEKTK